MRTYTYTRTSLAVEGTVVGITKDCVLVDCILMVPKLVIVIDSHSTGQEHGTGVVVLQKVLKAVVRVVRQDWIFGQTSVSWLNTTGASRTKISILTSTRHIFSTFFFFLALSCIIVLQLVWPLKKACEEMCFYTKRPCIVSVCASAPYVNY